MRLALEQEQTHLQSSSVSMAGLASWVNASSPRDSAQRFLRVQICEDQTCLIAIEHITAVRTFTLSDVVPVPQMQAWVLGFYRGRDQTLWLIDLAQQMGMGSLAQSCQTSKTLLTLVVHRGTQTLGLLVSAVHDIESYSEEAFKVSAIEGCTPELSRFVKGYFDDHRSIVLDISAVFENLS